MTKLIAACLLLLSVVACASTSAGHARQVGTVTLTVTGGFTGWNRRLTVDPNGTATLNVIQGPAPIRGPHAISNDQLARLRSLIGTDEFAHLNTEYPAPAGGADLQAYDLTAVIDGKQKHTVTYDGANRPQVLSDVLSLFNEVLASFAQ